MLADSSPSGDRRDDAPSGLRRRLGSIGRIPLEAILVGLGLFAILAAFAAADPVTKITNSVSPFTDEAFNVVNARNFVQVGVWSTDEWNLHLVNLPFSLVEAATFGIAGVGIVQARLAMILCVSLTAAALVWGLRGVVGRTCATFAGLAFGFSGLILFYGRLAFLEDLVVLGLTLGTLVLARDSRLSLRGGIVSGLCYAVAIGAKPSALFAVVGILATIGAAWGWRDSRIRRWLAGTSAVIALAGLVWMIAIWLPNQAAVAIDLKIWASFQWNLSPVEMFNSAKAYLTGKSDHIFGFLLLPLIGLGFAGLLTIVALRKRLDETQARLTVAAFGWAALGFGILMIASYRPNRYVVPLVPSLAILAAIGLHLFVSWLRERLAARAEASRVAETAAAPAHGSGRSRRLAPGAVAVVAIVAAMAPGLAWYGNWARHATYDLVAIQNQFADAVPPGQIVAGDDSALFFMRSKARTFILDQANNGDIYAQGARWYLLPFDAANPNDAAIPNGVPEAVWAARERVMCASWRGGTECLFHLR
jgi:4-amino-4-deoxy-L-arabinose transferase-like glycosyltransferase